MKKLKILLLIAFTVAVLWHFAYPSGTWRYKVTVTVQTPEGLKTGSAVREVRAQAVPKLLPENISISYDVKGEAVIVDLGKRGILFGLLPTYYSGSDGRYLIVDGAYPYRAKDDRDRVNHYDALKAGPDALRPANYPMFVRFRDPADPKTVENLLEFKPCSDEHGVPNRSICLTKDRFTEAFGAGVALKSVTIEMTDEPVTEGVVAKYRPPISRDKEFQEWLRTLEYSDPLHEVLGGFKKG